MIINKKHFLKKKSKIDSGPFAIKARDKDVSRQSVLVSRRREALLTCSRASPVGQCPRAGRRRPRAARSGIGRSL